MPGKQSGMLSSVDEESSEKLYEAVNEKLLSEQNLRKVRLGSDAKAASKSGVQFPVSIISVLELF